MTARDRRVVAAFAALDGQPVARCPHCGGWEPAGPYVAVTCSGCGEWYQQWWRIPDGSSWTWAPNH